MHTSASVLRRRVLSKRAESLPGTADFAAIASQSALDGTARRTQLSLGRDGIMQLVDLDRGNRAEDARVVGLRTLHGAVRTDRERSRIRRELLRQISLANSTGNGGAQ